VLINHSISQSVLLFHEQAHNTDIQTDRQTEIAKEVVTTTIRLRFDARINFDDLKWPLTRLSRSQ